MGLREKIGELEKIDAAAILFPAEAEGNVLQ